MPCGWKHIPNRILDIRYILCISILNLNVKYLHNQCCREYAVICDGTPSFAEAECINIRIESNDWAVHELILCLNLFAKKLNGEELARHIIDTLQQRLQLSLKSWYTSHQDRAKANKACLDLIQSNYNDTNPSRSWWCAHSLSNTGKRLTEYKDSHLYVELLRKLWQKVIQYKGKARNYAKHIFKEIVKCAHGVHFFVKFEQLCQISEQGPIAIVDNILPHLQQSGWSEKSTHKML